jgi:hypothetical protein
LVEPANLGSLIFVSARGEARFATCLGGLPQQTQPASDAEHAAYELPLGAQLFQCPLEQDVALGQDNMPSGKINQIIDVLVDNDDRDSFPRDDAQRRPDIVAHLRCEAFGGFAISMMLGLQSSTRPIVNIRCSPPES